MSSLLLRGFVLGLAIAASPGPIFFLCVRRTLIQGRLAGLLSPEVPLVAAWPHTSTARSPAPMTPGA